MHWNLSFLKLSPRKLLSQRQQNMSTFTLIVYVAKCLKCAVELVLTKINILGFRNLPSVVYSVDAAVEASTACVVGSTGCVVGATACVVGATACVVGATSCVVGATSCELDAITCVDP